ncbi:hypothetical protein HDU97_003494 [Phlyctochytrium planicorne]|nr:hypothetical protein HDU97_003494 [Phlyctochytrium planicorne]
MASKGITAPPEVVYKMSKKIAQLTKVIYYLNTKNEDHNVEVQSLIDAYEEELSEAIRDGTSQLEELRAKLDECSIKVQAQDAVIQTYLETIAQNENEINNAKQTEEDLREHIAQLETNYENLEASMQTRVERLEGEVSISAQSTESLKNDHEVEVKDVIERYEAKIASLKDAHEQQILETQLQHSKNIKIYMDECRTAKDQLKDIVSVLNKQHDEQIRSYQNESKDLREFYEAKIRDLENETVETQRRLRDELGERNKAFDHQSHELLDCQEQLKTQTDRVRDLNITLTDRLAALSTLQANYIAESAKAESFKRDLASKTISLAQNEASLRSTREALEKAQLELTTLTQSLDAAIITVRELNERIHDLNRLKAESDVQRIEKERAYKQLLDDMEEHDTKLKEEMKQALVHQEMELNTNHAITLKQTTIQLEELRIRLLQEKQKEIDSLVVTMKNQEALAQERSDKEKASFDIERANLEKQIGELNEAKNHVKETLAQTSATLDEKIKEINAHTQTIKNLVQTIKGLEVDKADMFQKMLRIDNQIREEMNEKFRQEKIDLEIDLENEHILETEKLKDAMTLEHHLEMKAAVQRTENEYGSKIAKMAEEHLIRNEEWENLRSDMEKRLANNAEEIKIMLKTILELKESHSKRVIELSEQHQKTMETEKKNWEFESSAKETQQKVSATIALNNLEKKYKSQIEEVESSHRKQVDELRKEHTINTLALKKEAEGVKNSEIAKLKAQYEEQIDKLNQAHINEMAQTVLAMNVQRIADLKASNESHDGQMKGKQGEITQLNETIQAHIAAEQELKQRIDELESDIKKLSRAISAKSEEIVALNKEHLIALRTREDDIAAQHEAEVRRLHEEHISEAESMMKEFDKAQTYLKKQITAQAKQLQEADLRYINREPREVDLQKISELEDDIKRRKRKVASLMEELDYYKLELNNREANFNKIFNKTPLVGVIEPLKYSPKMLPGRESKKETPSRLPPLFTPLAAGPRE